jgi:hypothetical protein
MAGAPAHALPTLADEAAVTTAADYNDASTALPTLAIHALVRNLRRTGAAAVQPPAPRLRVTKGCAAPATLPTIHELRKILSIAFGFSVPIRDGKGAAPP